MLRPRVIPCLLLQNNALVKTLKFKNPSYIGDPLNAMRIYNELEVDELILLSIDAGINNKRPPFKLIADVAEECFMPFTYGGGIKNIDDAKELFKIGVEKIALNAATIENPKLLNDVAEIYGTQAVIAGIDVKNNIWGKPKVFIRGGKINTGIDPVEHAKKVEELGAGEILLYSIERDGTFMGYDLELIKKLSQAVRIPVIACGGAGTIQHFAQAVKIGGASAVAAGSMMVYQNANKGILINFPLRKELNAVLH